jgi:hypothetical protein
MYIVLICLFGPAIPSIHPGWGVVVWWCHACSLILAQGPLTFMIGHASHGFHSMPVRKSEAITRKGAKVKTEEHDLYGCYFANPSEKENFQRTTMLAALPVMCHVTW